MDNDVCEIVLGGRRCKPQGVCFVSVSDFEWLNQWNWRALKSPRGALAVVRSIQKGIGRQKKLLMHRVIMNAPDGLQVDHRDHDPLNNTRGNLRLCTGSQNQHNQSCGVRGTSQYKGVSWDKASKRWKAGIGYGGKTYHLGAFCDEHEAAIAYNNVAREQFGEFACLNVIDAALIAALER